MKMFYKSKAAKEKQKMIEKIWSSLHFNQK